MHVWTFSHTTQQFSHIAGHPTFQLHSDTSYLEIASDSSSKGLSPPRLPSFQMSTASPGCHLCFWPGVYTPEVVMGPSLGSISGSQNLEGLFAHQITDLLQRILKDTHQQPHEEIHRESSRMKEPWFRPHRVWGLARWQVHEFWVTLDALHTCHLFFCESFIPRHDWLNPWPLRINLNFNLSPTLMAPLLLWRSGKWV